MYRARRFALLFLLSAVLSVPAGCSLWGDKVGDAVGAGNGRPLEVPPELDLPQGDEGFQVPSVTSRPADGSSAALLPDMPRGRLVTEGDIRYLEVDLPVEKVWSEALRFLRKRGFAIESREPALGIIQTAWKEGGLDAPQGWFGKWFGTVSAAALRDRYRLRLERVPGGPGKTRIFVTHQGMESVLVEEDETSELDEIRWQLRPPAPEQEAELLLRFLVFLGLSEAEAKQALQATPGGSRAEIGTDDGAPALRVRENFARTWRRVGLAMDRLGLVVEDRDRSRGLYFIRLGEDFIEHRLRQPGFFDRLFKGETNVADKRYRIRVAARGEGSVVRPYDEHGEPLTGAIGKLLITLLHEQLR